MRRMSFALTTPQVEDRSKTVTRRAGWSNLKVGQRLSAVKKAMGFRKGETAPAPLAQIEVVSVRREPLERMLTDEAYGRAECIAEGFPQMTPAEFVTMFCETHRVPDQFKG